MAEIVSINISSKKGMMKDPIPEAVLVPEHGINGDVHAGNWHRQISLLAQESVDKMQAMGLTLSPGNFAENITTRGLELYTLPVGTQLTLGECLVEVTQIGKECHHHCEIYHKVGMCVMPTEGIFVKVLKGGSIRPGDAIEIVHKPQEA